jgi:hypothetical protein
MSVPKGEEQPTQAVTPGAEPTQQRDDADQGNAAMVDPATAAQAEFGADPSKAREEAGR